MFYKNVTKTNILVLSFYPKVLLSYTLSIAYMKVTLLDKNLNVK